MIARAMLVWLAVIIPAGFVLYQVKFEVRALEEQLADTGRQTERDLDAIQVLRAEWSFLNEPRRIESLNQRHLGLGAKSAGRVREIESIPLRPVPPPPPAAVRPQLPLGAPEPQFAPALLEPMSLAHRPTREAAAERASPRAAQ